MTSKRKPVKSTDTSKRANSRRKVRKVPSESHSTSQTSESENSLSPPPDPFDPESLRLGQDFASSVGVKKIVTTVPCRKPNRHEFVRVRPGPEWRLETAAFEDKTTREVYLVDKALWSELAGEIYAVCLFTTINRQGDVVLWPVKLPGPDGRSNNWNESALAAAGLAETRWVRLAANMTAGMYDTYEATGELAEPEWPAMEFPALLKLCFKGRCIESPEHPVMRALRGEV